MNSELLASNPHHTNPMDLQPGALIDVYIVRKPIAAGGQGRVYLVEELQTGAFYAVKVVQCWSEGTFRRAEREARILASLRHDTVVTCHKYIVDPRMRSVTLVMDYVDGAPLRDCINGLRGEQPYEVLHQIAIALDHIHQHRLVHRDLSLANILIDSKFHQLGSAGHVKLIDFGIAIEPVHARARVTATGCFVGVGPYLPPEELLGDTRLSPDERAYARDLFAFGVLAWRVLCKAHPTGIADGAQLHRYSEFYQRAIDGREPWPPPMPGPIHDEMRGAVEACLALSPTDRPSSGGDLLRMLRRSHTSPSRVVSLPTQTQTMDPSSPVTRPHPSPVRLAAKTEPMPPIDLPPAPASTTTRRTPPAVRPPHPSQMDPLSTPLPTQLPAPVAPSYPGHYPPPCPSVAIIYYAHPHEKSLWLLLGAMIACLVLPICWIVGETIASQMLRMIQAV